MTRENFSGVRLFVAFHNLYSHYSVNKSNSQAILYNLFTFVSVHKSNVGDFMFYNNFVDLCNKVGKSPSAVAEDMGYQRSVVTRWSKGTAPRQATLQRIADYFGVPVTELTEDKKEKAAIDVVDDDLKEYLDELRNRPEMRMLFSTTKTATKAQIEAIVKFIEGMQNNQ